MDNDFFSRKAEVVAKELLGVKLVREINGKKLKCKIIETEAYYDEKDPASRARQKGDLRKTMLMQGGTILVYGVHNNWLLNFVTGRKGEAEAVLIRAIKPLNFSAKTDGPGLLTRALKIDKKMHKQKIGKELWIEGREKVGEDVKTSKRIGVREDLNKNLRFYIDNKFVSR